MAGKPERTPRSGLTAAQVLYGDPDQDAEGAVSTFSRENMPARAEASRALAGALWQPAKATQNSAAKPAPQPALAPKPQGEEPKYHFPAQPVAPGAEVPWAPQELPANINPWTNVPEYKKEFFKPQPGAYHQFQSAMYGAIAPSETEAFVNRENFAAEGGIGINNKNGAASGITGTALAEAKKPGRVAGLEGVERPEDLTLAQRAQIMRYVGDRNLGRVGGHEALERLSSPQVATTVYHTLYNHGEKGGADLIRAALQHADPSWKAPGTGRIAAVEFDKLVEVVGSPERRRLFLDGLAKLRKDAPGANEGIIEHLRWPDL